ncbi:MAG: copper chaperone PCu(A)C [Burkholderiaceae bacterium]
MNFRYFLTTTLCLISLGTQAKTTADGAWARATVAGQNMGGAFVTLTSDRDAQLIGATSPVAEKMELHTMKMEGEKMLMAQVSSIPLPANTQVQLKPGSLHLMFMGLKQPLAEGQTVPITLKIQLSSGHVETLTIQAPVKSLAHSVMHH